MRKALLCMTVLGFLLAACAAPAQKPAAAPTAGELRELIAQYKADEDYEAVYEAAEKLIELEPSDTDAYLIAVDALSNLSKQQYDEINRLVAQGAEKAENFRPIADWIAENQPEYIVEMPFFSDFASADEINTDGITTGNMTNCAKYKNYGGWWLGGLLTWQGDYVYLSRPDEDFAIYKMRFDGSGYAKIDDNHGSCLNVIGDWIYFVNHDDGNKPYKMRTDGSMKLNITDDECGFLSAEGDYVYYHNGSADGGLYKVRVDGSEKRELVKNTVMFCCVADGYVYYAEKRESSPLYRIPIDGGTPSVVIDSGLQSYAVKGADGTVDNVEMTADMVQNYCVEGGYVYYFDAANHNSVRRVRTDGTGNELFRPFDYRIAALNVANGQLVCSLWYDKGYEEDGFCVGEEIVKVDANTLERQGSVEADTEPVCTGPDGWIYYMKFGENLAWYALSPDGAEYKIG